MAKKWRLVAEKGGPAKFRRLKESTAEKLTQVGGLYIPSPYETRRDAPSAAAEKQSAAGTWPKYAHGCWHWGPHFDMVVEGRHGKTVMRGGQQV